MDGVILIDKPAGPTSAEVVRQLKERLGQHPRVGHLGTLDPFATGILPILIGEATKLAPFLQAGSKEYLGLIALGAETDTLDPTGNVVRIAQVPPLDRTRLGAVIRNFTGIIEQSPPVFSAIKRGGVPLYKLARQGIALEPPAPRRVEVSRLELQSVDGRNLHFVVVCSSGMYVRSLARDIGIALGTVGHLRELRRVRSGSFSITDAQPLSEVLTMLEHGAKPALLNIRQAIADFPEIVVDVSVERRLRHGDSRALDNLTPSQGGFFKVVSRGELVAIARSVSRVAAAIERVFGSARD